MVEQGSGDQADLLISLIEGELPEGPASSKRVEIMSGRTDDGVIINMLDYRARSSIDTLQEACRSPPPELLFDIPITRSPAFLEASALGVPLAPASPRTAPSVAGLFEVLAASVLEKLGLCTPLFEALQLI